MEIRVLAIGDIVGESGLAFLEKRLRPLQRTKGIGFTVVNGENAAGVGLTRDHAWRIYDAGADAVTLGNHTFGRMEITGLLDEAKWLLRPANYTGRMPGRGCGIFDMGAYSVRVINLIGRCELNFHAEATSEKGAMGWYLDGRAQAVWGTHTHVPTADEQILPGGAGYITDLGMTGPIHSVLGIRPEQSVETFLGGLPGRYQTAPGPCKLQGAIFTLDSATGLCAAVERIDVR